MDWKRRRTLPEGVVKRVAIVGGTHGNETNGVQLAKHFSRNPDEVRRSTFATEVIIANEEAVAQNTRYVEEDLNRCFLCKDLIDGAKGCLTKERKRAREVDAMLGPKCSPEPRCDLVVDLHNTTAASGIALLMAPDDDFAHELAYHLMSLDDGVRIVEWNVLPDWALTASVGRSGMTFEVGPCPWGCVEPALFVRSRRLIRALLDYVELHNGLVGSSDAHQAEVVVPVYRSIGVTLDYPRDDTTGALLGMVHPELQGGDFRELKEQDPLFMSFGGEVTLFSREQHKVPEKHTTVYALFVNEAAYYEKNIALMLMSKAETTISILKRK